jgi:hypothetical protein
VLTRFGELGIDVRDGCIHIDPRLLPLDELLGSPVQATFEGLGGESVALEIAPGSLAFTFCQLPFILREGDDHRIEIVDADGRRESVAGARLDRATSAEILGRRGRYRHVEVTVPRGTLYRWPSGDSPRRETDQAARHGEVGR